MNTRAHAFTAASAASGLIWGGLAYVLIPSGMRPPMFSGLLGAPLIGVLVGRAVKEPFAAAGRLGQWAISVLSLYVAVALFGVAIALGAGGSHQSVEHLYEAVVALWVGLTFYGLVVVLWPLAFLNHSALRWLDKRAHSGT